MKHFYLPQFSITVVLQNDSVYNMWLLLLFITSDISHFQILLLPLESGLADESVECNKYQKGAYDQISREQKLVFWILSAVSFIRLHFPPIKKIFIYETMKLFTLRGWTIFWQHILKITYPKDKRPCAWLLSKSNKIHINIYSQQSYQ